MKNFFKKLLVWNLVLMMVFSTPIEIFAQVNYNDLTKDKSEIINKLDPVKPAKPKEGQSAADLIKNPEQPNIYTLRKDYKVQNGEKYRINYQPYIASVGEAATKAEKDKVNKEITLPELAGYDKSHLDDTYTIDYDTVKNAAKGKNESGNDANGKRYQAEEYYKYKAKANKIKVKHVFQDLEDFSKYTNPDGTITHSDGTKGTLIKKGEDTPEEATDEEIKKHEFITSQNGNTGSTMEVTALEEKDRKGFVPEADSIIMQVPENAENFVLEYRYNRAHYDVNFDTKGGTALPNRTLYYEQTIPKIDQKSIPKKTGCDFLGWMPSVTLTTTDGKTFNANEIIKDGSGDLIENLDVNIKMPAEKITFTAVWKDKEKADYAIQFWAEKSDHADGASLMDKYDFMGTRVYKDQDTGMRPDLDNVSVKDIVFPDLNQARLNKIWAGDRFNRGKDLYLNKFFVYNQDLTHDQNKDPENVNLVKSVDATGKTVYNIYYDRQVYDLYFTKSNAQPEKNTIYPEIWGYDTKKGESVMLGGPGKPYHYKARFNEMMYKWPNDAKQTKGFTPGYQSFGWGPNYDDANWPLHLDTPPYRLNADEFLDMTNYTKWGGYTKHIDKGDGTTIDLNWFDYKILSFGIKQDHPSIPHHMDFWMDGFKPGETIIRYDLVRTKADTAGLQYGHRYPKVTGFTPHDYDPKKAWPVIEEGSEENGRVNEEEINDLNDERDEITPNNCGSYYNNQGIKLPIGQLDFIPAFYSDQDDFGDVKEGGQEFTENGYLQFHYKRNKYPLRFNYDPTKIKDDSEFNSTNQLDTFYEFPLKVLSPNLIDNDTEREDREYFKEDPKNLLDNPENLQKLGLTDLVFTDPKDGKLKVKRPEGLSDQMVFKGWALDPAGTKLIWENPKETMPTHPLNLYAKWGEPDYQWKVTFDPNGGNLRSIKEENLTTSRKTIQVGDIVQDETKTFPIKETNDGDKQVFTVVQRQKLVEPKFKPTKKGYDFMGWEVIQYKKDDKGDYTDEIDNSYRETYKVPELYSFGNDVVSPIYLKAIWVPNQRVDVKIEHYFLDDDYKLDENEKPNPKKDTLEDKRSGYLVAATGDRQDDKYLLAPHDELEKKLTGDLKTEYEDYNKRVGLNNSFFQTFKVEPEKILNTETNKLEDNPKLKNNVFKFFYRPFRHREYKVNYIDERFKGNANEKDGKIIDQEIVKNGNRHYDARNYRPIPGWVLTSAPQQQLFFDVNEDTNEFLGINGTGKDEITFYYKDVRVIDVPNKDDPVPDGYVRVTFKADKGGAFTDKDGKKVTELNYDVIKGLKSDLLPVPNELKEGESKEADKYYIRPENGKKFTKWDNRALLNDNTIINEAYTFTAYFDWSGLSASGLVRTEAYKDPNGKWTNDFAPKIEDLKKQLVWKEKDQEKPLPAGTEIKFFDEDGKELKTDEDVFKLVNEQNKADKDELVRTVNIKVKATFKDGTEAQELEIPVKIYKNVYEALTGTAKPLFLKDAESSDLKDITGEYVKVTVAPTGDMNSKDNKVYYVNPKAWVSIPEVKADGSSSFINWTADIVKQNDDGKENGNYDFGKRHKFTEETVIKPVDAKDVVEQTDPNKKPPVPNSYVKVIVKTTDKATDITVFEKTFWVNPNRQVAIDVKNPTGKTITTDTTKYTMNFSKWESEEKDRTWEDKIVGKFVKDTTIIAKYSIKAETIKELLPTTDKVHTPQGKTPTVDEIKEKITPPEGKTIAKITIVKNPDVNNPGESKAKVIIEYTDGSKVGTNEKPVEVPVEVHKNIIPEEKPGKRPDGALENYVKVIFKAGEGGSLSGNLVYYVSPEVEVDMKESADSITKTPNIGFINGDWDTSESKKLKAKFTAKETEFTFNFKKSADIVEKTDDPNQEIPKGYVKVTFKTEDANKGKLEGDKEVIIYYVNPKAGIKLKVLGKNETPVEKELKVPETLPAENYVFDKWQESIDEENPITDEKIHVAMFQAGQVTLTYNKGGADVTGDLPANVTAKYGATVRLAGAGNLKKPNASFAGWKLDEDEKIYQPGDQVTLEKARTATAQWTTSKHKVIFNSMGGSDVDSQEVAHQGTLAEFTPPTKDGKVFMGWKEKGKESQEAYFDLTSPITEDKTLIAFWQDPVQEINEGDPVEEQFIKVTFSKGEHGDLNGQRTYKVAKDLSFEDAVKKGLNVPTITPDKYYKAKDANSGWDKELKLQGKDIEFIAQYEPEADVIPVDPDVTDDNQIEKEKPEGMVLVTFKVSDDDKLYIPNNDKYYVKKNTEVRIPTPVVLEKTIDAIFNGWQKVTLVEETLDPDDTDPKAEKFIWVKQSFDKDTIISDENAEEIKLLIKKPFAGDKRIYIQQMSADSIGKLELIRDGEVIETVTNSKFRRKYEVFNLSEPLQSGDVIRYWQESSSRISDSTEDLID
ncbi:InlB B-repeat-containing protein [Anaerococcus sp. Marseille-P9784]|uniref:InlB B-repeat-containing protein n=1 Tax=Anaerococcus sp. Marseille-P9784 TaxID=2614127 RepID=UPI00124A0A26|nr:InlB B-repeat-containing protein [Anaerococcus sp. Marseille-P9784]